jgi:hypothetical protein
MAENQPSQAANQAANQAPKKIDVCREKYPPSPDLDQKEFPKPKEPTDGYFANLPKDKLQAINDKREGLNLTANEKKERTLAEAEDEITVARSAHDVAKGKFKTAKNMLDLTTINKKKQFWRDYHQSLREAIPKNQAVSQNDDIEKLVPDDKKAISIAILNQNLATLELEYRKTYQQLFNELGALEDGLKLATDKYDATTCTAAAQEFIDRSSAEATWRQDLSDALASK